mmetsp:Transcript_78808/g.234871  ORF Transcript_78808/g.234871 Transcript_78808/m.234871 type:complete len:283 (+) Transcript_78808:289-1137(+)
MLLGKLLELLPQGAPALGPAQWSQLLPQLAEEQRGLLAAAGDGGLPPRRGLARVFVLPQDVQRTNLRGLLLGLLGFGNIRKDALPANLPTVPDRDLLRGLALGSTAGLHHPQDLHAVDQLTEHHVLAVQVRSGPSADEELRAVGVRPRVRHGQDTGPSVSQPEVLVPEGAAIDGLTTSAVSPREVAPLAHEAGDDSVELGALVVQRLPRAPPAALARAEAPEVLDRARHDVREELEDDPARVHDHQVEAPLLAPTALGLVAVVPLHAGPLGGARARPLCHRA